ncbi:hypothetical protein KAR91_62210 [Candidatus Pacearchaeota archaeon]|nr:hypothetical protein [Candidatus Pacearchaeota archaeon]
MDETVETPPAEIICKSKILDLISNHKARMNQLTLALDERTLTLQRKDPPYQYLLASKSEIENQIAELETLMKNSDNK